MTRLLAIANDFVQPPAAELGTAKKIGFALAASGLYIPASVLVDENGNTIDTAIAGLVGAERGLVTRPQYGTTPLVLKALPANAEGLAAMPVWNDAVQLATYDAGARAIVTSALTANTAKAVLSIEHSAAATKTVKIRRITIAMLQTTALAGAVDMELHRGTAASTAGTARTPSPRRASDPASEAVVKTLPTITAATVLDTFPCGGFATTTTLYSPPFVAFDWQEAGETKPYLLRPGVLESFVINLVSTAAHNLTATIAIDFTEE